MAKKLNKHGMTDKSLYKEEMWLVARPEIRKLINGEFKRIRHRIAPGTFKISGLIPTGFKLTAFSCDGVRTVYLHVDDAHKTTVLEMLRQRGYEFTSSMKS